jgi:high affinity Mn2+ porin
LLLAASPKVSRPALCQAPGSAPLYPGRFWLSGQANFIGQAHPPFRALYSGPNSLDPSDEQKVSTLATLYTGARVARGTSLLFDLESAGGRGIGHALGLAGYTNLDVVRSPTLGAKPYIARMMLHHVVALSSETEPADRNPLCLWDKVAVRRLELRAGKFSLADFFDVNPAGSDSHTQFMNWTVDNNGAYDYAADTRGYTYSILAEYWDRGRVLRFAEALMPKVANGLALDFNVARARAENLEFQLNRSLIPNRQGAWRFLTYVNHANMGKYRDAIHAFLTAGGPRPNVAATARQGRIKYGFGVNVYQELAGQARLFGRFGWNEGHNESFAYTEVNQTIAFGGDVRGQSWGRGNDKLGVAFVWNAISGDHRSYLALGGLGFLLGDGALHYGWERILEAYYTMPVGWGLSIAPGIQYIVNPGYNQDRGPVITATVRLHYDLNTPWSKP